MNHDQAFELLESYSLGLLQEHQYEAVEAHLDLCTECRARLRELSLVAEAMAESVDPKDPSPHVEQRLMASVRARRVIRPHVPWAWRLGWWAAAAASLAALYFGTRPTAGDGVGKSSGVAVDSLLTQIHKLEGELDAYQDATLLLGQPGMQFIDMAGVAPNGQAFGKVVIGPDGKTGIVYMYQLPATPAGMEYQLWVMHEGKPTSAGTFSVAPDGSAMLSLQSLPELSRIAAFEVTIEPVGGQPEPTGMMYLTGPNTLQFHR